jgi:hemolysin activation/secretion protein
MNKIFPSAVFALLAAGAAQGAEPDHLNVQEPARPAYLERKPQGDFSLPPLMQEEAAPAPGATGIVLEAVRFVGNTAIATADLQAVARPYLGRPLGIADLEILRRKVTLLYVERGYVNSGAVLATDALDVISQ